MPRIRQADQARLEATAAAQHLAKLVGEPKTKKARPISSNSAARQMEAMRVSRDWKGARAVHLVALYAWCHENVYGVAPAELGQGAEARKQRQGAISAARTLTEKEFGGKIALVVAFMIWVWRREKDREAWKAKNGVQYGRITWRTQFAGRAMLTEFRLEQERKRHAPR